MPTKRKKQSSTASSSSKKAKASVIDDLYKKYVTDRDYSSERDASLHEVVWKHVCEQPTDTRSCRLMAVMTSLEHKNGVNLDTALKFVKDPDTFCSMCDTVFDGDIDADIVHFMTVTHAVSLHNSVLVPAIQYHARSWAIWNAIPTAMRQLLVQKENVTLPASEDKTPFVVLLVTHVLGIIDRLPPPSILESSGEEGDWNLLHRSLELLIDLCLSTGRNVLVSFLESLHLVTRIESSLDAVKNADHPTVALTTQLLDRLDKAILFPIGKGGDFLEFAEVRSKAFERARIFQKMCRRYYAQELPDIVYAGLGVFFESPIHIRKARETLSETQLIDLVKRMRLIHTKETNSELKSRKFLTRVLERYLRVPPDPLKELKEVPLFPTEELLWDFVRLPPNRSEGVLNLPKLQTRFLTFPDYLKRNFELARLACAYDIRTEICHVVKKLQPSFSNQGGGTVEATCFRGWDKMASELADKLTIKKVTKPCVGGGLVPSKVFGEFSVDLASCGQNLRREWDDLREHDTLFLVEVDATRSVDDNVPSHGEAADEDATTLASHRHIPDEDDIGFRRRFGIVSVRGCTIVGSLDRDKEVKVAKDSSDNRSSTKRRFLVALDPTQYHRDVIRSDIGVYGRLNVVVRRNGRENNFKPFLESLRGVMTGAGSMNRAVPSFMQATILGHDGSLAASESASTVDLVDTFLDEAHLKKSFPDKTVQISGSGSLKSATNFRLQLEDDTVLATSYSPTSSSNLTRFTPNQVQAIVNGLSFGLSLVVGPPGTGKTDVAVQILSCLYHSFPEQRTVVITHSNAALNDIFAKVVQRGDVDELSMIRLGSGERTLKTDSSFDFTKAGRATFCLEKRMQLLEKVQELSDSMGISGKHNRGSDGAPGYTCESADYFRRHNVQKAVGSFQSWVVTEKIKPDDAVPWSAFPFSKFCASSAPSTLAECEEEIFKINSVFDELQTFRPFEIQRQQRQRTDFLLTKRTRIVAMTCTHAAISRSDLLELGFEYDNLLIEEAGQMTEVEAFIPLLLQRGSANSEDPARLKRVTLIGDHNQLPPVIKHTAFAKYSNLDQSMLMRLIKSGVPYTQLDMQGRSRSEIASLYNWRYRDLGNLDHVTSSRFQLANPGFVHTMQLVNVENFQGKGETCPVPHYFQNEGEAEFVVALFQYMVLIGYDPEKISILATYQGQRQLISEIVESRCGDSSPLCGIRPHSISTVDQYQGQQNDYILLSLVRTGSTAGHLADVRRLTVAMSRARLGLYVFCRETVFSNVATLKPAFDRLMEGRPTFLELVGEETVPSERKSGDQVPRDTILKVKDIESMEAIVHALLDELTKQLESQHEQ